MSNALLVEKRQFSPLFWFENCRPGAIISHLYRQPPVDLFGEIVVTHDDIFDWVSSVAPSWLHERSFANYVRSYDVAGKIRAAKLHGTFDATTARASRPWHARLALNAIC